MSVPFEAIIIGTGQAGPPLAKRVHGELLYEADIKCFVGF